MYIFILVFCIIFCGLNILLVIQFVINVHFFFMRNQTSYIVKGIYLIYNFVIFTTSLLTGSHPLNTICFVFCTDRVKPRSNMI